MMKKAFVVSLFILILQPLSLLGADPGTRRWRTNLVRGSYGGIAIAPDGTLYTAAGELVAIAPDGSIRWNRFCGATGGRLSAPVIGADGTIYVHNDDTEDFWAVNPDGTTKWSLPVPTRWPRGLAIGADGTLYKIGWHRSKNELRALRPDGSSLWSFQTNGNVGGSPVVSSDGTILVASHVGHTNYPSTPESVLYAVNPNGEELWRYETPDTLDASPAVDRDGNIYISSSDGEIYSLDRDGNLNWQFST